MLGTILIAVAVVLVALVSIIASRPADFQLTRSAAMAAPASAVFDQVNNFHNWEGWSPWAKLDPNMKATFDGAPSGEGAIYSWSGGNKVGEGRMTILESVPGERVLINLEFMKPFKATNKAEFTFTPDGDQTVVQWRMTGRNNFMAKAFDLVMNMDKMVGKDFEKGLASMKSVVEGAVGGS